MSTNPADNDKRGGYVDVPRAPDDGVFEIGLVMAGAVSAGAYTAGVLDFLVEALDAWESAKAEEAAATKSSSRQWSIPGHSVRLRVVSGASAGAMTGAIAAAALKYDFPHVRSATASSANPFYQAWVEDIDISRLLETRDLDGKSGPVVSVLDSTVLSEILPKVLSFAASATLTRPWVQSGVRYIFTQTNLRGVPYFLSMRGNTSGGLGMIAHADYQSFHVLYEGSALRPPRADDVLVTFPNSTDKLPWHALGQAALASGAFPIGLAPRVIERDATGFNYRFVVVPGQSNGPAQVAQLDPMWPQRKPPSPFRSVVVDGGTMNNEPLNLAHAELAGLAGSNERTGKLANRALVLIDPFPDEAGSVDDPTRGQSESIFGVGMALLGAWKDQARFDPEDLGLADADNVYSRFLIAPSRGTSTISNDFALASGALGGFSGFLSREYRNHDFLLGRRNCQQFLREHFCLPIDNEPVFGVVNNALTQPGSKWIVPGSPACLPIIPLFGSAAEEQPLPDWPKGFFRPELLTDLGTKRIGGVLDNVLRESVKIDVLRRGLVKVGLVILRSVLVKKFIEMITKSLAERGLA